MSFLENELRENLLAAHSVETGVAELEFRYPETLSAFQGHFPGHPILPGICMLQSLRIGMEKVWAKRLHLVEIANAKFLTPAQPGQTLLYSVRETMWTDGLVTLKAKVTRGDERMAEFTVSMEARP